MHTRRWITFLLGSWFTLVIAVTLAAPASMQVARRAAQSPPGEAVRVLGDNVAMTNYLFGYVGAEINRQLAEMAGLAELALALALLFLLFLQNYSRPATILAGVLLLAVCASHFLLTPQLVAQGRLLDFRPEDMQLPTRARYANLQVIQGVVTAFRLLCGAGIAAIFLKRGRDPGLRRRRGDLDGIDDAEDRHINR